MLKVGGTLPNLWKLMLAHTAPSPRVRTAQLQGNMSASRSYMSHVSYLRVAHEFHTNIAAAWVATYLHQ